MTTYDVPSTPRRGDRSPYFTPPRTGPITRSRSAVPALNSISNGKAKTKMVDDEKREAPPTPQSPSEASLERRSSRKRKRSIDQSGSKRTKKGKKEKKDTKGKDGGTTKRKNAGHDPLTSDDTLNAVLAKSEKGVIEPIGKIHLIQERVRHDPWKMLIATCLLNVTSGRAARPVYVELLRRWPTPQALAEASVPDLTELLYPLGLFNQRASSLIRFSQQYLSLAWPIHPGTPSSDPHMHPTMPHAYGSVPEELDVHVFAGAGRYASDSFRIYSDLFPGGGGPEREKHWLGKRDRAKERYRTSRDTARLESGCQESAGDESEEEHIQGWDVEQLGEYLSEEEDVGEEEWRNVRPNDKELRRYLIWRWGLEGILYDIKKGPVITRERDLKRLSYLC